MSNYTETEQGSWIDSKFGPVIAMGEAYYIAKEINLSYYLYDYSVDLADRFLVDTLLVVCCIIGLDFFYEILRSLFHLFFGNGKFGGIKLGWHINVGWNHVMTVRMFIVYFLVTYLAPLAVTLTVAFHFQDFVRWYILLLSAYIMLFFLLSLFLIRKTIRLALTTKKAEDIVVEEHPFYAFTVYTKKDRVEDQELDLTDLNDPE